VTIEALREATARLNTAATALAALGAALDSRVGGHPLDSAIQHHLDEVLSALRLEGAFDGVAVEELAPLLAEIRTLTSTNAKLLDASSREARGAPSEPAVMQAAGDATARFPHVLATLIAPKLDGLVQRLSSPGAAFLDIGVGVAALSIQMARTWPELRVVGVDVWAPALALARENVRAAGFDGRIELRHASGQSILDEDAFDLAWIPSLFVPESALPELLRRVHRSLRAGGWLLFPMLKASTDPLTSSVTRLRTAFWGGSLASMDEIEQVFAACGFTDVRRLPSPPIASTGTVAARKAATVARHSG
jgi:precorrin-6B methylase 2